MSFSQRLLTARPPSLLCRAVLRRGLQTSLSCCKAGHYKITPKGDRPLTYEQAHPPYRVGVTKGWNSWNTSTLMDPGQKYAAIDTTTEDEFIRNFIFGTWQKMWLSEVLIKRKHNTIVIAGIVCPLPNTSTMHFLIGYTEELLSHFLKWNIKVEVQAVESKKVVTFKHI